MSSAPDFTSLRRAALGCVELRLASLATPDCIALSQAAPHHNELWISALRCDAWQLCCKEGRCKAWLDIAQLGTALLVQCKEVRYRVLIHNRELTIMC